MLGKFSFAQMTSNSDGKTSASGTMGCLICAASALGFIWGAFTKQSDLITQAVAYAVIGAGLLGYRKSKDGFVKGEPVESSTPEEVKQEEKKEDKPLNS